MSRYKLTVRKSDNTAEDVFFNVPDVNGKYEVKFLLQNKTNFRLLQLDKHCANFYG